MKDTDAQELKTILADLPKIRWNVVEKTGNDGEIWDYGYMGDEIDNIQHMEETERYEYFINIVTVLKKLKDKIESL